MAIRGEDGSIILTTKIDETGLKQGMASMKGGVKSLTSGFTKLGAVIATTFSIRAIIKFSNEASKMASTTEASVQRLIDIYGEASQVVGTFIDTNARALGMSKAAATQFSAVYGNLFSVWADQEQNAMLTTQYLNATAVVASKTGRTMADVQERIRSGLLGNTEAVEDLGIFVNVKTIEMTEAFQRVAKGAKWDSLTAAQQSQVRALAILEQATKKYGTEVANTTALTRAQYDAAFQDFKNTWGKVVNLVLMPILRIATRILNTLTRGLQVLAGLSGKTIENNAQIKEQENAIGGAVKNQEALTDAVKETAKEQKKLLAGFDDLQILTQQTSNDANNSGAGAGVGGEVDGSVVGGTTIDEGEYTEKLAAIGMVTGWALVGLGIILMFSGHPLIGVGMVASGWLLSAGSAEGGTELGKKERKKLQDIAAITGAALIGLGILVLFTPFWKLGLGMIASGASAIYSAVALGKFSEDVKEKVTNILLLTGAILLVLGAILLFVPGAEGVGVAMLAAGAGELFAASVLNADKVKTWVTENCWVLLEEIAKFIFVVGIMLMFNPATMYLGFGAMIAGVAILAISQIVPNYDAIKKEISTFFNENWKEIALVSAALLVLGIMLLFTPAWGVGLALIAAAGGTLWSAIEPNWDFILGKLKETWENIKTYWNTHIAKYFSKEWWGNLAKTAIKSFITWIINGLNKLIEKLNSFGFKLPDVLGGGRVGFNIEPIKVPALARGAVLPPNKPFLAMVGDQKHGTNIEAPAELIKQMAMEAMLEVGATGQTTKEEHYYLNETELMNIIYKLVKGGERLRGNSLISGGAY